MLGTTVGDRYHVVALIGEGKSGTIYRAEHVTLGRRVAIKVLHHELSQDDLAVERFRREATSVGGLDNEHIVQIHDFGRTDDGRLYLAMEYLEGETLEDRIRTLGPLGVTEAVDVLIQLGEALVEAHSMGFVHRDLRPRNLFLAVRRTSANFLKLLDFGLAKLVEQEGEAASTSLGMTFGDPHYMSPEQAKGEPVDRRADIYSMGCIAYEMLSGSPPFHGDRAFDVLMRHVEEKPRPLSEVVDGIPSWLEEIVMSCLAKSSDDRFVTSFRLVTALREGRTMLGAAPEPDKPATNAPAQEPKVVVQDVDLDDPGTTQLGVSPLTPMRADKNVSKDLGSTVIGIVAPLDSKPADLASPTPVPGTVSRAQVAEDSSAPPSNKALKLPIVESTDTEPDLHDDDPHAGLSEVWYADGEQLNGGAELSEDEQRRLDAARGRTPSQTGIVAMDDVYYDDSPRSFRLLRILLLLGATGGLAVAVVAFLRAEASQPKVSIQKDTHEQSATVSANEVEEKTPRDQGLIAVDAGTKEPTQTRILDEEPESEESASKESAGKETALEPAPKEEPKLRVESKKVEPKSIEPKDVKPKSNVASKNVQDVKKKTAKQTSTSKEKTTEIESPEVRPPNPEEVAKSVEFAALGRADFESGDIPGAAANFNKARALDPKNADANAGLGEVALSQGAYGAAARHLSTASRLRPMRVEWWVLLGEAYLGDGSNDHAADAFKRALKLNPDNARARNGYNEATGN